MLIEKIDKICFLLEEIMFSEENIKTYKPEEMWKLLDGKTVKIIVASDNYDGVNYTLHAVQDTEDKHVYILEYLKDGVVQ